MKNFILAIFSSALAFLFLYLLLFIYTFNNLEDEFKYVFKSKENLEFHKKYSKKLHHIRDESALKEILVKPKKENLLFDEITKLKNNNLLVLFQGDSWMEQITRTPSSIELIKDFKSQKNITFINAGTTSYAPSLMSLQIKILEEDFAIFPEIVIAYIDQTDFGDELCRYKKNKIYKNGNLIAVKPEDHTMHNSVYNYSKIYSISNIHLSDNSKIVKTYQLINFKFYYLINKSSSNIYRKYISRKKTDKEILIKCYYDQIEKYLINPKKNEINYFEKSLDEYVNKLEKNKHIEKIFLVTFPHRKHFITDKNGDEIYKYNVAQAVNNILRDKKKTTHINFSEKYLDKKNFEYSNIWSQDLIHLDSKNHSDLFIKNILNELQKDLTNLK